MKCPKCGYTSFPYLERCRKCDHGLMEQHAAFGIYALRPDSPDLLLAYQAASTDVTRGTLPQPLSAAEVDLGQLDEVELEVVEGEPTGPEAYEVGEEGSAALELGPSLDLESAGEEQFPPVEPGAEPVSSEETGMPQTVDLSILGDITLELEKAADLGSESPENAQTPRESSEVKQVYDLDLDEDGDGVTLGFAVDRSPADDEDEESVEYTLEIEDDLELEVDELELEEDDEAEEEDDDDR